MEIIKKYLMIIIMMFASSTFSMVRFEWNLVTFGQLKVEAENERMSGQRARANSKRMFVRKYKDIFDGLNVCDPQLFEQCTAVKLLQMCNTSKEKA